MKTIQHYQGLFNESVRISVQRLKLYFPSVFLETIANILFVLTVIVFWNIIYENFPNNKLGFTTEEMYVYLAFVEIFMGLKAGLVFGTGKFWRAIYSGQLLSFMIRPIHPMLLYLINGVNLHLLFRPIPIVVFLLYRSRDLWTISSLLLGLVVVFASLLMVGLMELTFSTFALYFTKMNAMDEIVDSLLEFTKYPITAFHFGWQLLFTIVFPFMFYSTIPAVVTLESKDIELNMVLGGCLFFLLWGTLISILWKKGMKRYDGFGG